MECQIKVLFFDLFFTLIVPRYHKGRNEYDIPGMTQEEWEKYAEDPVLYTERASGKLKNPKKIIERITDRIKVNSGIVLSVADRADILHLRTERMKKALLEAESEILDTLQILKNKQLKLCLISNADVIDMAYWSESALSQIFDTAVFSCDAGYLKPDPEIYREALQRMQVNPEQCMFIGDGGSDELKGAKEAGIITVLAGYYMKRDEERLTSLKKWADYYVTDIKELLSVIQSLL